MEQSSPDPVQELITLQKQNQQLLQELLTNQVFLLEKEKDREKSEKRKIWWQILKYIFWGVVIIWTFRFTQNLTQNMLGAITGTNVSANINLSDVLNGALKGGVDPEVQKELEQYLGK